MFRELFSKRSWWRRFIAFRLRQECAERIAKDHRTIIEILNERSRAYKLYVDYERHNEVDDARYWEGYKDAIAWVLKVK